MSEKINFGADYVNILAEINMRGKDGFDPLVHAARGIFLLDWGLSISEIDEATALFFKRLEEQKLDEFYECIQRVLAYVQGKQELKERLLIQVATTAFLDDDVTESERKLLDGLAELLDFRPSEANTLYARAVDLKIALQFFADACKK